MQEKETRQPIDAAILRVLDANLNRAREGLRVLEDTARFVWNHAELFRRFRAERHRLDHLTRKFYPALVRSRQSQKDEGRKIIEPKRKNSAGIVAANMRRCEESLRVLEEYGKLFSDNAAAEFKKSRFRIYDLEKLVLKKHNEKYN